MKILMLVLASDGSPEYLEFQSLWRIYRTSNPNIDCFFYKGNPNMEKEAELVGDTIYVKILDSLDTVYEKFMMTLRFLEPQLDKYDFMYRTNLSSFIDFTKYVRACRLLPTTNVCAAVIGQHERCVFPSGAGFTLSIDLVKRLIQEPPAPVYLDDVTIGNALCQWNIQWIRANRIDFIGNGVWAYEHDPIANEIVFHFRIKTEDRTEDVKAFRYLVASVYISNSVSVIKSFIPS